MPQDAAVYQLVRRAAQQLRKSVQQKLQRTVRHRSCYAEHTTAKHTTPKPRASHSAKQVTGKGLLFCSGQFMHAAALCGCKPLPPVMWPGLSQFPASVATRGKNGSVSLTLTGYETRDCAFHDIQKCLQVHKPATKYRCHSQQGCEVSDGSAEAQQALQHARKQCQLHDAALWLCAAESQCVIPTRPDATEPNVLRHPYPFTQSYVHQQSLAGAGVAKTRAVSII